MFLHILRLTALTDVDRDRNSLGNPSLRIPDRGNRIRDPHQATVAAHVALLDFVAFAFLHEALEQALVFGKVVGKRDVLQSRAGHFFT